tara:strand:- start:156094 stop:156369 length:276 start_codon:yes stop_codon:yes gene_type:complete
MKIDINENLCDIPHKKFMFILNSIKDLCTLSKINILIKWDKDCMFISSNNDTWDKIETGKDLIIYFSGMYSEEINTKYFIQINKNPIYNNK